MTLHEQDQHDLQEYAASGSRQALGRLAERHIDFIYGVARRELGDAHLAEDVAQAVILVLAHRAKTIQSGALSSWLFMTTRNVAANARKSLARRQFHERRTAALKLEGGMSHRQDSDTEQLHQHLHTALAAQREADRSIVLMRYVQGMEIEQICDVLKLTNEAARKRLSRAVERLREFMVRRGIATGGGAICAALIEVSEAAPQGLASAAVGSAATSSAAALANAATTWTATANLKVAAAILIASGLFIGIAANIWSRFSRPAGVVATSLIAAADPLPPATALATLPTDETVVYSGVVTDPEGKPLSGVRVWSEVTSINPAKVNPREAETVTDAQGHYALPALTPVSPPAQSMLEAMESVQRTLRFDHPAHAMAWKSVDSSTDAGSISIRFEPAVELSVQVMDLNNQPVMDAEVFATLRHNGPDIYSGQGYGTLMQPGFLKGTRTDFQGIARFERIPRTARADVTVLHSDFVQYSMRGDGSPMIPAVRPGAAPLGIRLEPGGRIRVTALRDGKPVFRQSMIRVTPADGSQKFFGGTGSFDAQGSYLLRGLPPGNYNLNLFSSVADTDTAGGVFLPAKNIAVTAGQTTDVAPEFLESSIVMTGRTLDDKSKLPIPNVYLTAVLEKDRYAFQAMSGPDGRFSVRVAPGTYELRASGPTGKSVTVAPGMKTIDVGDVEVIPFYRSAHGRLTDPAGNAVAGKVFIVDRGGNATRADGSFVIDLRVPSFRKSHFVFAFNSDRTLGRAIIVDDNFITPKLTPSGPVLAEIPLRATAVVSGRVVDVRGNPVSDAEFRMGIVTNEEMGLSMSRPPWGGFSYDAASGRFTFGGIPNGVVFSITATWRDLYGSTKLEGLNPGEVRDLGDMVMSPRGAGPSDPDDDFSSVIAGQVLDSAGRPIMGLRTSAVMEARAGPYHNPEDTTDQEGRFILSGLPKAGRANYFVKGLGYREKRGITDIGANLVIHMDPLAANLIGKPAPELDVVKWVNSPPLQWADLKGKVVLLQIGEETQWDGYLQNSAHVADAAKKYADKGLVVIAIHRDPRHGRPIATTVEKITEFVIQNQITYPFAIDAPVNSRAHPGGETSPFAGETQTRYGLASEAGLVLIDRSGIVRAVPDRTNLNQLIEQMLAQ